MERSPGPGQGRVRERPHVLLLAALLTLRKEVWIKSSVLDERIKNVGYSSHAKECNLAICNNVDGARVHYAK